MSLGPSFGAFPLPMPAPQSEPPQSEPPPSELPPSELPPSELPPSELPPSELLLSGVPAHASVLQQVQVQNVVLELVHPPPSTMPTQHPALCHSSERQTPRVLR